MSSYKIRPSPGQYMVYNGTKWVWDTNNDLLSITNYDGEEIVTISYDGEVTWHTEDKGDLSEAQERFSDFLNSAVKYSGYPSRKEISEDILSELDEYLDSGKEITKEIIERIRQEGKLWGKLSGEE